MVIAATVLRDLLRKKFMDLFFLLVFIIFVFFPHLIIQESWGASRNFTLIEVILVLYLMIRLSELIPIRSAVVAGLCGFIFIGLMAFNISVGWVKPQVQDADRLRTFVQTLPALGGNDFAIVVIPPVWDLHEKTSPLKVYYDEFNDPLFLRRWPIEPGIKMLYLQQHPGLPATEIEKHIHVKIIPALNDSILLQSGTLYHLDLNN
jgi:hypothetical protein